MRQLFAVLAFLSLASAAWGQTGTVRPCAAAVGEAALSACLDDLVAQMTLEEKAALLSGDGPLATKPLERLGIPRLLLAEGGHGLRVTGPNGEAVPATAFPLGPALAATWSPQLLRRVGVAMGEEARALGVDVVLGPGLNLHRSPLGGHNVGTFSEDPVLAGELAAAQVQGLESQGVAAAVKHFVAHHQQTGRFVISAEIDPRALRELYLRAFEIAVVKGDPSAVVAAPHRLGGVPVSQHAELLRGVLRTAWGFDGLVLSDRLAVDDPPAAHAAGLDLRLPGAGPALDARVVSAVRAGELEPARVDAAVRRLLRLAASRPSPAASSSSSSLSATSLPDDLLDHHHQLAREAAAHSLVLLRNAGDLLPIKLPQEAGRGAPRLAVIGAWARTPRIQALGADHVRRARLDSPLAEISRLLEASGAPVPAFAPAYDPATGLLLETPEAESGLDEARRVAAAADVALVFVGTPPSAEVPGRDRADLGLAAGHDRLVSAVAEVQENVVVVLQNGGPVQMPWLVEVDAVVETWLGGQGMGGALADVLFGRAAPAGKLPMTFPGRIEQTATYPLFPSRERRVVYGEGLFVGYRHFDIHAQTPLFPFGHGLGYDRFEFSDLEISGELTPARSLAVRFTVTNPPEGFAGPAGEVAQLYVAARGGRLPRPDQTLADFARVELAPGESRRLELEVEPRDVTVWDEARQRWILDATRLEVRVGTSSREIRLRATAQVTAPELPPAFDRDTSVAEWLAHPRGEPLMAPLVDGLVASALPAGAPDDARRELRDYLLSLPAVKLVQLSRGALDLGRLDAMIRQVNGP